jgi:predicted dehydrogenase
MDAAIRAAGVISAVGFQMRYDAWNQEVARFLGGRRLVMMNMISHGTLESHSVKHTHTERLGGPGHRVWTASAAWSGGTVVEAGIHQTDLMRFWAGDIAWVQAAYVPRDPGDIEDGKDNPYGYAVTYGFECGAVGTLLLSRLRKTHHQDGYQIVLWDHGHLKMEAEGPVAYTDEESDSSAGPVDPARVRRPIPVPPRNDATADLNRAFVRAVRERNPSVLRSTFETGMNSLAAVLAANASHLLQGRRIDLRSFATSPEYGPHREKP